MVMSIMGIHKMVRLRFIFKLSPDEYIYDLKLKFVISLIHLNIVREYSCGLR